MGARGDRGEVEDEEPLCPKKEPLHKEARRDL